MGSEATIRYLKARLAVMEEELSEATASASEREQDLEMSKLRIKELEEEKARSTKSGDSMKVKLEKMKAQLEEKTKMAESFEHQFRASVKVCTLYVDCKT